MKRFAPAIILLNYNGSEDTLACLDSLRTAKLGDATITVVDNGSLESDLSMLLDWNERTAFFTCVERLSAEAKLAFTKAIISEVGPTLLLSPVNRGFAAGNNLATRLALARGQEEVLLLNNDTTVYPDFLQQLAKARTKHPEAVLTPQIRRFFEPHLVWNCGGDLQWPGRKTYKYADTPVADLPAVTELEISFVTGCALLYQPEKTGLLTERFFFGEEDMEFSLRLRRKGIPIFCALASIVYHKVGRSLSDSARKSEIFTLKRLVNLRRELDGWSFLIAYTYYLLNLLRLLLLRYRIGARAALKQTFRVGRLSLSLAGVGKELCVDYVQGAAIDL